MSKSEEIVKMMSSENGSLYAAVGGIVVVYAIDRITRNRYVADVKKDSITLSPAGEAEKSRAAEPVKNQ